jgi:hypothetical protein
MTALFAKLSLGAITLAPCVVCQVQPIGQRADQLPVTLSTQGGGCCFQVDDSVTIAPNGDVKYTSRTPNFREMKRELPGMGEYAAQVPATVYESIAKLAREQIQSVRPSPLPPDSLVQSVYFDKTKEGRSWACCNTAASLNTEFAKVRDAAIRNPIRVLALECDQSAEGLNCLYRNIGKQVVATFDPINVASISCGPQLAGPRATPKVIHIAPGKTYSIAIGRSQSGEKPCEEIRIDSRYVNVAQDDVLLVELHAKIRASGR